MANTLISIHDITKEKFNMVKIEYEDVSQFLLYYMQILQIGVENELISEEVRNGIGETIANAIAEEVDDEEEFIDTKMPIANYMYVIALYLMSMTNWQAWKKLIKITSFSEAIVFIREARDWFLDQVESLGKELRKAQKSIIKIKFKNVQDAYKILERIIGELKVFFLPNKISLKERHSRAEGLEGKYFTLKDSKSSNSANYLKQVQILVYSFCTEVSIMSKMDTKQLEKFRRNEREEDFKRETDEVFKLENKMKKCLKDLKKEYVRKLNTKEDEIVLTDEYERKKNEIYEQWTKEEEKLNEENSIRDIMKGELINEDVSLMDLIKEYAIFSQASKGEIAYPKTMEERGMALAQIEIKDAMKEFLDSNVVELSEIEINYLKSI